MRLLLASQGLSFPGGSETYLVTLAQHLQRLGHEVHAAAAPGSHPIVAEAAGLATIERPADLRTPPDRIIVQDAIMAGELAAAWPDVPQLFVIHSGIHDLQLTSAVPPSVAGYVTLNDRTRKLAEALPGGRTVFRLTQPVDVGHFTPGSPPNAPPRVLLVFGNNRASWRFDGLSEACSERDIEVRRLGAAAGNMTNDPAPEIRKADIVVGYGRCILEAMSCGRAALVFDRFGSDGWVTPESYPILESAGFNGRAGGDHPGRNDFGELLDAYASTMGAACYDLAIRHHDARNHAVEVVDILRSLGPVEPADPDLSFTLSRVWREAWRWESRALDLQIEVDQTIQRALAAEGRIGELKGEVAAVRRLAEEAQAGFEASHHEMEIARELANEREEQLATITGSRTYRLVQFLARVRPRRRS